MYRDVLVVAGKAPYFAGKLTSNVESPNWYPNSTVNAFAKQVNIPSSINTQPIAQSRPFGLNSMNYADSLPSNSFSSPNCFSPHSFQESPLKYPSADILDATQGREPNKLFRNVISSSPVPHNHFLKRKVSNIRPGFPSSIGSEMAAHSQMASSLPSFNAHVNNSHFSMSPLSPSLLEENSFSAHSHVGPMPISQPSRHHSQIDEMDFLDSPVQHGMFDYSFSSLHPLGSPQVSRPFPPNSLEKNRAGRSLSNTFDSRLMASGMVGHGSMQTSFQNTTYGFEGSSNHTSSQNDFSRMSMNNGISSSLNMSFIEPSRTSSHGLSDSTARMNLTGGDGQYFLPTEEPLNFSKINAESSQRQQQSYRREF